MEKVEKPAAVPKNGDTKQTRKCGEQRNECGHSHADDLERPTTARKDQCNQPCALDNWITFLQVSCTWASSAWLPTVFSCFGDRGPQVSLAQQKGKKTAILVLGRSNQL